MGLQDKEKRKLKVALQMHSMNLLNRKLGVDLVTSMLAAASCVR